MKQTAVEYLLDQLTAIGILEIPKGSNAVTSIIEQAKEIEKQQIIDARNNGFEASGEGWNGEYGIKDFNFLTELIESEQYYNETFNNK
jgi:hypothetical protein